MNWYGTSLGEAIVLDDTIAVMGELVCMMRKLVPKMATIQVALVVTL